MDDGKLYTIQPHVKCPDVRHFNVGRLPDRAQVIAGMAYPNLLLLRFDREGKFLRGAMRPMRFTSKKVSPFSSAGRVKSSRTGWPS